MGCPQQALQGHEPPPDAGVEHVGEARPPRVDRLDLERVDAVESRVGREPEHDAPPLLVALDVVADDAVAAAGAGPEGPVELDRRGRPALGRPELVALARQAGNELPGALHGRRQLAGVDVVDSRHAPKLRTRMPAIVGLRCRSGVHPWDDTGAAHRRGATSPLS
jgi:hypothetical protein